MASMIATTADFSSKNYHINLSQWPRIKPVLGAIRLIQLVLHGFSALLIIAAARRARNF